MRDGWLVQKKTEHLVWRDTWIGTNVGLDGEVMPVQDLPGLLATLADYRSKYPEAIYRVIGIVEDL